MAQNREVFPATSLVLFATALLLFGAGGGLVGYVTGERHGEARAVAIIQVLGTQWDRHRANAKERFQEAIGNAGAQLEKAAADLKSQVSMYHGCGGICGAIANQFSTELLHARDSIQKDELAPLANWEDALRQGGIPIQQRASAATIELGGGYSNATVMTLAGLLCATVVLCVGIACVALVKLRASGAKAA
jgi:hypothetical protein